MREQTNNEQRSSASSIPWTSAEKIDELLGKRFVHT